MMDDLVPAQLGPLSLLQPTFVNPPQVEPLKTAISESKLVLAPQVEAVIVPQIPVTLYQRFLNGAPLVQVEVGPSSVAQALEVTMLENGNAAMLTALAQLSFAGATPLYQPQLRLEHSWNRPLQPVRSTELTCAPPEPLMVSLTVKTNEPPPKETGAEITPVPVLTDQTWAGLGEVIVTVSVGLGQFRVATPTQPVTEVLGMVRVTVLLPPDKVGLLHILAGPKGVTQEPVVVT